MLVKEVSGNDMEGRQIGKCVGGPKSHKNFICTIIFEKHPKLLTLLFIHKQFINI